VKVPGYEASVIIAQSPESMSINVDSAIAEDRLAVIAERAEIARLQGRQVVVVQGLGFVGAAVASVVADARDGGGEPLYFVVGLELPNADGHRKIASVNAGRTPVISPDSELSRLTYRASVERGNLCATTDERALGLADVILVDVQLDVAHPDSANPEEVRADMTGFERAIRSIGRRMQPDALVMIETTVPIGACEKIVKPILDEERSARSITAPLLLAHAYERVMPGPRYVDSIRRFWRSFSGIDEESTRRAREFLESFIKTDEYPLHELAAPAASELAKLLENSYRAINIAFIYEWTLLAEQTGVNLFEVIDSIKVRRGTHDNIRYPGFGVGGYCLTKDGALAQWAARQLYGLDVTLDMTLRALKTNHRMPLHTLDLLKEVLTPLPGRRVLLCGASYLPEVGDTRHSPAELFVNELKRGGAEVLVHDPYVNHWRECPDVPLFGDLERVMSGVDAVVFAVRHPEYMPLTADEILKATGKSIAVVDAQNIISDDKADALFRAGCRVTGVGKGHWRKFGYHQARRG